MILGIAGGIACSMAPRPAAARLEMESNPTATVSGIVVDSETGDPVAGIEVFGLPRGKDVPWEPGSTTDSLGAFTLHLAAPAPHSFLLRFRGVSVVTPEPGDPACVDIQTIPGGRVAGIRLKFLRSWFERSVP
ncbi:MAG: carboxypeptidase-like regulatory domain-containing protein [Thermoanaerobaculia bacterium]